MGMALALPDFGTEHPSPEQLKVLVDELISHHFFAQVVGGISSAERRFQVMDSDSAIDRILWRQLRPVRRQSSRARRFSGTARCDH